MFDITITLIQANLAWENPEANIEIFTTFIAQLKEKPDIVILPEMFSTGFTMKPESTAETMGGQTVAWLRKTAVREGFHIAGSIAIRDKNRFYNRLVWATPENTIITYDKRHLFRMADEHLVYTAGSSVVTIEAGGWNIRPFICYDLRFPVWCRNVHHAYDIAIFVANWPAKRAAHWKTLLAARAIENQCYVIGCNRTGFDGNSITYSGDSSVIDYQGRILARHSEGEGMLTVRLSKEELESYREHFPVHMDADEFALMT